MDRLKQLWCESLLQVLRPSLEHSNGQVRDAAVQLTLELYRVSPAEVRRGLPADTPTLRKSLLWRTLIEKLDQIDGKPFSRQLKLDKQQQEKARMDEVSCSEHCHNWMSFMCVHIFCLAGRDAEGACRTETSGRPYG